MKHVLYSYVLPVILAAFMFAGAQYIYAWVGPTKTPPAGNVASTITASADAQVKKGGLVVGGLAVFGTSVFSGTVKIADGTQGMGKVLTSDAEGNASWQYLPTK